jgi:hypothetical protein
VAAVDHHALREAGLGELGGNGGDVAGVVIWALVRAAEDDVRRGVAFSLDDGRETLFGDGEEDVLTAGGADGVEGDVDRAVGAVLEADRRREARSCAM